MRSFILGTDWGADCDDCVALRVLSRFVKKGEINLLGIGTLVDSIYVMKKLILPQFIIIKKFLQK